MASRAESVPGAVMDVCAQLSTALTPEHIAAAASILFFAAKAITIFVPTPPPNTLWGRLYHVIETIALLVGHAKETGTIRPSSLDGPLADALKIVGKGKTAA